MRRLVLALVVLASPAAAQDEAVATVNAFLAAPAGPLVAAAHADSVGPDGGRVRIDGLAIDLDLPHGDASPGRWTFAAPTVLVSGLACTADGFRADKVEIPAATLAPADDQHFDGRLDAIEIVAPAWPAATAAHPATGPANALEPVLRFLAGSSAQAVHVGSPGGTISLGPVAAGRIATAEIVGAGGPAGPPDGTRIALEDLDVGAVADALFSPAGPARIALSTLRMTGIANAEGSGSADAFVVTGVSLTPQSPPLADLIDGYLASQMAAARTPPPDPSAAPPPSPEEVDVILALWQAAAVDRVSLDGFTQTDAATGEASAFDHFTVENVGPGRAASLSFAGLAATTDDGTKIAIREISLAGFRPPEPRFVRTAIFAGDAPPDADVIVGLIPVFSRAAVEGVAVTTAEGVVVDIDEASAQASGHIGPIPTLLEFAGRGAVTLPKGLPAETPEAAAMLAALEARGLTRIAFDAGSRIAWADGRIEYRSHLDVPKLARYAETYALSGIPRAIIEAPQRAMEIVAFLSLDSARVELADAGLVAFAREAADIEAPGTFDTQTTDGLAQIDELLAPKLGAENAAIVRDAFTRFLAGNRTIALAATPDRPVPLTQLGVAAIAPRALVDLLHLKLTVTP